MAVCCVGRGRVFSGRRKIRNFAFTMLSSSVLCDILMNESGSRSRFGLRRKAWALERDLRTTNIKMVLKQGRIEMLT